MSVSTLKIFVARKFASCSFFFFFLLYLLCIPSFIEQKILVEIIKFIFPVCSLSSRFLFTIIARIYIYIWTREHTMNFHLYIYTCNIPIEWMIGFTLNAFIAYLLGQRKYSQRKRTSTVWSSTENETIKDTVEVKCLRERKEKY